MGVSEFDIIRDYFTTLGCARDDVICGIGDDAALLQVPPDRELAVSLDTLVAGVHFPLDTPAAAIGHKALAVGLSDLAAMGAEPAWLTLGLTLPGVDPEWLAAFSGGMGALAREHRLQLVGGDTTRGPLSVTVQVHGLVPAGQAFLRSAAVPGDHIYVTGTLGDAGLALRALQESLPLAADMAATLRARLDSPTPRLREALGLRGLIHAAIDVSDGLCADLGHILNMSGVGATLWVDELPLSAALQSMMDDLGRDACLKLALGAGDDYELCFTSAPENHEQVRQRCAEIGCAVRQVGVIGAAPGLRCRRADGSAFQPGRRGYDHFEG